MKKFLITFLFCGMITTASSEAFAGTFQILPGFSNVLFKAPYIDGFTLGGFSAFQGQMELDANNAALHALNAELDLRSVTTNNHLRDVDLQGPDLFDTAKFPTAQFKSKRVEEGKIVGDLTLKGKTKEVSLDYQLGKVFEDKSGRTIAPLTLKGQISRKDFGILYNRMLEGNKPFMEDKIEITAELAAILIK